MRTKLVVPLLFSALFFSSLPLQAQTLWHKLAKNPVISPAGAYGIYGTFDEANALSPSVLYDNGVYKMWYVGYRARWSIGYAISEDGIIWGSYTRNPVLTPGTGRSFETMHVWLSDVIRADNKYYMYYSGNDGTRWRVGLAQSYDCANFWRDDPNPVLTVGSSGAWDERDVWGVSVVRMASNDYRMWFSGQNNSTIARIGYATSSDGVHWTKHTANPILNVGPSGSWDGSNVYVPRVVFHNGVFHMFYLGNGTSRTQIGYATSADGITWSKHAANPVLRVGGTGEWDSYALIDHDVLLQNNTFKIWYGGANSSGLWQIGFASSPLSPQANPLDTKLEFSLSPSYPNPFNPETTIDYDVATDALVTIKVYNSIGEEVTTLVNEQKLAGRYSVVWNARGVASGTYWMRMAANGKSVVQKMILVK